MSKPKTESTGKVVRWALRDIGKQDITSAICHTQERASALHMAWRKYESMAPAELVRVTIEPWPPAPKPKKRRKQPEVFGEYDVPSINERAEIKATAKSIRRTIKALEKKIK